MVTKEGVEKASNQIKIKKIAIEEFLDDMFLTVNKINSLIKSDNSTYFLKENFSISKFKQEPALGFRILHSNDSKMFVLDRSFGLKISQDNKLLLVTILGSLETNITISKEEFATLLSYFNLARDDDTEVYIAGVSGHGFKLPTNKATKIDKSDVLTKIQEAVNKIRDGIEEVKIQISTFDQREFILEEGHEFVSGLSQFHSTKIQQNEIIPITNSTVTIEENKTSNAIPASSNKNTIPIKKGRTFKTKYKRKEPEKTAANKKENEDVPDHNVNKKQKIDENGKVCFQDEKNSSVYTCMPVGQIPNVSSSDSFNITKEVQGHSWNVKNIVLLSTFSVAAISLASFYLWKGQKKEHSRKLAEETAKKALNAMSKIKNGVESSKNLPSNSEALFKYIQDSLKENYDYLSTKIENRIFQIVTIVSQKVNTVVNTVSEQLSLTTIENNSFNNYHVEQDDNRSFGDGNEQNDNSLCSSELNRMREDLIGFYKDFAYAKLDESSNLNVNNLELMIKKIADIRTNTGVIHNFLDQNPYIARLSYYPVDFIKASITNLAQVVNKNNFSKLIEKRSTREMLEIDDEIYEKIKNPGGSFINTNTYALFLISMLNKFAGGSAYDDFENDSNEVEEIILNLGEDFLKLEKKDVKIIFNNNHSYKFLLDESTCVEFRLERSSKYFEIEVLGDGQVSLSGIDNITPDHEFDCQIAQKV